METRMRDQYLVYYNGNCDKNTQKLLKRQKLGSTEFLKEVRAGEG